MDPSDFWGFKQEVLEKLAQSLLVGDCFTTAGGDAKQRIAMSLERFLSGSFLNKGLFFKKALSIFFFLQSQTSII